MHYYKKICTLLAQFYLSQYSYLVRNIINYVSKNSGKELTLTTISAYFGKAAIKIFSTMDSTVAETANHVGIHDQMSTRNVKIRLRYRISLSDPSNERHAGRFCT